MTGRNDQPANQTAATRERAQIYPGGSAFSASQASSGFHESCVMDKCLECCGREPRWASVHAASDFAPFLRQSGKLLRLRICEVAQSVRLDQSITIDRIHYPLSQSYRSDAKIMSQLTHIGSSCWPWALIRVNCIKA